MTEAALEVPEDEQIVGQVEEQIEDERDYDAIARRMGWKPKDEYRGPPGRWRDAKTFVEHGENELPVLRERLREIDRRGADTEAKLTKELTETRQKLDEAAEVMVELRDMVKRGEERGYAKAKSELEAQMAAAVETSDIARFNAAKTQLDALDEGARAAPPVRDRAPAQPAAPVVPPPPPATSNTSQGVVDPEITEWTRENQWFERDPVLKAFAIDSDQDLMRRYPGMSTRDRLEEVTKRTLTKFPEKFAPPRRQQAAAVAGSNSPAPRRGNGKAYDDLPPEAKAACDRFIKTVPGFTKEDYCKTYFEGE